MSNTACDHAAIDTRLDAHPAKTAFTDEELKPAVFGKFLATKDLARPVPAR